MQQAEDDAHTPQTPTPQSTHAYRYPAGVSDIPYLTHQDIARFWHKVDRVDNQMNTCWPWTKLRTKSGKGRFWIDNHFVQAKRIAWAISRGEAPTDEVAVENLPGCCAACVRPTHLRVVASSAATRHRHRLYDPAERAVAWEERQARYRTRPYGKQRTLVPLPLPLAAPSTVTTAPAPRVPSAAEVTARQARARNRVSLGLARLEEAARVVQPSDPAVYGKGADVTTVRAFYQTVAQLQPLLRRVERAFPLAVRRQVAAQYPHLAPLMGTLDSVLSAPIPTEEPERSEGAVS